MGAVLPVKVRYSVTVWVTALATVTTGGAAVALLVFSRHPPTAPTMPMAMSNQAAFTHEHIDALRSPTTGVSSRCSGHLVTSPAVGPVAGGPGVTAGPGHRAVAGGPSSSVSPSHAASRRGSSRDPHAFASRRPTLGRS